MNHVTNLPHSSSHFLAALSLEGASVDGVGGSLPLSLFFFFFSGFHRSFAFFRIWVFFFLAFPPSFLYKSRKTAIFCKIGEFHSDPVCADPIRNFPTRGAFSANFRASAKLFLRVFFYFPKGDHPTGTSLPEALRGRPRLGRIILFGRSYFACSPENFCGFFLRICLGIWQ